MTMELLARIQFALTAMFHVTFPAITVGLSIFLTVMYGIYWRTGKLTYLHIFRFWRKIFAVGFALGVVSGAVLTFEFGLNWGPFAAATGPVIGPIIAMEVVTAFFLEAGFLGVLLYGDGRVKARTMFICTALVSLGTLFSTTWILAANSWLQTPAGYELQADGTFVPTDWLEVIFNPAFPLRFLHMLLAVLISASVFLAGISAYYLIKNRALSVAKTTFSVGLGVLAILIPVQVSVGDLVALEIVGPHQVSKLATIEAHWEPGQTSYNLFVIPDDEAERNSVEYSIPLFGSFVARDLSGQTAMPPITAIPEEDRPPVWPVFWGFRTMFYGSMLLFATAFAGVVLRLRGKLFASPRYWRWVLWMTPVGMMAIVGGWVTAEVGRQPWVVYGQLRTSDAVSDLAPAALVASVVGFLLLYLTMVVFYILYIVRTVRRGPEIDDPRGSPDDPAGGPPDADDDGDDILAGLDPVKAS